MFKRKGILVVLVVGIVMVFSGVSGVAFANEKMVSEMFVDTDLREVLNTIAYDTGVNIFMDQTVEGIVTAEFKNIPIEIVLAKILSPYGYCFKRIGRDYLVGTASPDSLSFGELSTTAVVKPDYVSASEIANSVSDFFRPFIKVNEGRNTITITGSPEMVARIKEDITKIDRPLLKKVQIRLVSLDYAKRIESEISLGDWEMYLGKGLTRKDIYGIRVGPQIFGASSEDDIRSFLSLKILSDLGEVTITGDQKVTVMETQEAKISRDKEGSIFVSRIEESGYGYGYYSKETVIAGQGVEIKVLRVTSENEILLNIRGRLEDIGKILQQTASGQVIWVDRRKVSTTVLLENYQSITIGTLIRKVRREEKGMASRSKEEEEIETIFLLTANVVDTERPPILQIEKDIGKFFTKIEEKRPAERAKRLAVGVGSWFSGDDGESILVYEAQLSLTENGKLKLLGGGGEKEGRYVAYGALKYGDLLNLGIGGLNSDELDKTELMLSGGLSIGTDTFRLEGDYFYLPNAEDESGVRAGLAIRF